MKISQEATPDYSEAARVLGYSPFIRISPLEFLTLQSLHGDGAFQLFARLQDPGRLYGEWAHRFAATAGTLPQSDLVAAADLHALVTSQPGFGNRRAHIKAFDRHFFGKIWPMVRDGAPGFPEPARSILLRDYAAWRAKFKARTAAFREQNKAAKEKRSKAEGSSPALETAGKRNPPQRGAGRKGNGSGKNQGRGGARKAATRVWHRQGSGSHVIVRKSIAK